MTTEEVLQACDDVEALIAEHAGRAPTWLAARIEALSAAIDNWVAEEVGE